MLNRKIRKEFDALLKELQINLENNYKDLAHDALNQFQNTLIDYYNQNLIKEKDYRKYKEVADNYVEKMKDYHH